jgi:hypothetical protein
MFEPMTIIWLVLEVIFLAAIARFAWRQRANKLVFGGWVAFLLMLVLVDYWYLLR